MLSAGRLKVNAKPEIAFAEFASLGGDRGWLYMDWAWRLRGAIDRILGGVGLRRGRRHPLEVRVGDALDFWRVESVEYPYRIRLRAEMKVPGDAWLQFEVSPINQESSCLIQTAYFAPRGLTGFLYWYLLYPVHSLIFSGLIKALAANIHERTSDDSRLEFDTSKSARVPIQVSSNHESDN